MSMCGCPFSENISDCVGGQESTQCDSILQMQNFINICCDVFEDGLEIDELSIGYACLKNLQ